MTRSVRPSRLAKSRAPAGTKFIEVEVDTLDQFDRALECGPDIILVDNLGPEKLAEAVRRRRDRRVAEQSSDLAGGFGRGDSGDGPRPGRDGRGPDQRRGADALGPGAGHRARFRSGDRAVNIALLSQIRRRLAVSSLMRAWGRTRSSSVPTWTSWKASGSAWSGTRIMASPIEARRAGSARTRSSGNWARRSSGDGSRSGTKWAARTIWRRGRREIRRTTGWSCWPRSRRRAGVAGVASGRRRRVRRS